jgi:hypothetical protein
MSSRFARKMTPTFIGRKKLYKGYRCAPAFPRRCRRRRSPLDARAALDSHSRARRPARTPGCAGGTTSSRGWGARRTPPSPGSCARPPPTMQCGRRRRWCEQSHRSVQSAAEKQRCCRARSAAAVLPPQPSLSGSPCLGVCVCCAACALTANAAGSVGESSARPAARADTRAAHGRGCACGDLRTPSHPRAHPHPLLRLTPTPAPARACSCAVTKISHPAADSFPGGCHRSANRLRPGD